MWLLILDFRLFIIDVIIIEICSCYFQGSRIENYLLSCWYRTSKTSCPCVVTAKHDPLCPGKYCKLSSHNLSYILLGKKGGKLKSWTITSMVCLGMSTEWEFLTCHQNHRSDPSHRKREFHCIVEKKSATSLWFLYVFNSLQCFKFWRANNFAFPFPQHTKKSPKNCLFPWKSSLSDDFVNLVPCMLTCLLFLFLSWEMQRKGVNGSLTHNCGH